MKSKKHSPRKSYTLAKKKSFLSLDFLNNKKTPFHGAALGVVLMVLGWVIVVSAITIIGLIIFVPSAAAMILKSLKKGVTKI